MSMEILTPMNKVERVTRKIAPATFVAVPGIWAVLGTTGILTNVATAVNALVNKLIIGNASSSVYESHDVEVGRIATMESHGIRIKVSSTGYSAATPVAGDRLVVSSAAGTEGLLMPSDEAAAGTYEIVGRIEEVLTGYIIFRTLSPTYITV